MGAGILRETHLGQHRGTNRCTAFQTVHFPGLLPPDSYSGGARGLEQQRRLSGLSQYHCACICSCRKGARAAYDREEALGSPRGGSSPAGFSGGAGHGPCKCQVSACGQNTCPSFLLSAFLALEILPLAAEFQFPRKHKVSGVEMVPPSHLAGTPAYGSSAIQHPRWNAGRKPSALEWREDSDLTTHWRESTWRPWV